MRGEGEKGLPSGQSGQSRQYGERSRKGRHGRWEPMGAGSRSSCSTYRSTTILSQERLASVASARASSARGSAISSARRVPYMAFHGKEPRPSWPVDVLPLASRLCTSSLWPPRIAAAIAVCTSIPFFWMMHMDSGVGRACGCEPGVRGSTATSLSSIMSVSLLAPPPGAATAAGRLSGRVIVWAAPPAIPAASAPLRPIRSWSAGLVVVGSAVLYNLESTCAQATRSCSHRRPVRTRSSDTSLTMATLERTRGLVGVPLT